MTKLSSTAVLSMFALLLSGLGCSSSSTPTGKGGSSSDPSSMGAEGSEDGGSSGANAATVAAPKITEVMTMMGALHVMWTNSEPACDSIEAERQAAMADGSIMERYKVVFTLPGDADNKMDGSATEDMTYTYRLRCKKGSTYSDYSNEMSANPMK